MSESGTQVGIARARSEAITRPPADPTVASPAPASTPSEAAVRAALAEVPDPELPVLSIIDLGIVHRVEADADHIRVEILPTFVGCPALDVIRDAIASRLAAFGSPVEVVTTFATPWTSERISPTGRAALAAAGIAPPAAGNELRCPHCASARIVMDSAFGPTQCRMLYYCRACRQPFEALKTV